MIFFALGILILVVSFIIAFISLAREQKGNLGQLQSTDAEQLINSQFSSADLKISNQPKTDSNQASHEKKEHLKTAAKEPFFWEQQDSINTGQNLPSPSQDDTKPPRNLRGQIFLKDMTRKDEV